MDVLPNQPAVPTPPATAPVPDSPLPLPLPLSLPVAAIDAAVRALDRNDQRMSIGPDESLALRVVKIAEECGEASAALIGLRGQNPRKERSPQDELLDELLDVALSALVAAASLTDDWAERFSTHITAKTTRLTEAVDRSADAAAEA